MAPLVVLALAFQSPGCWAFKPPAPIPVKGDLAAQALQRAYNAILTASLKVPDGSSGDFFRAVQPGGDLEIRYQPGGQGGTAEYSLHPKGSTRISESGNIHCAVDLVTKSPIYASSTKSFVQDYSRGADGSLTFSCSGKTRGDKPAQFKFVVNNLGKIDRELSPDDFYWSFMDVSTAPGAGIGEANLALHSLVCVDQNTLPNNLKFLEINAQQPRNVQLIKSAYNQLLAAITMAKDGEIVKDAPALLGGKPSFTITKNTSAEKVVTTVQNNAASKSKFVTIETLRSNGNVEIAYRTENPSQEIANRTGSGFVTYQRKGNNLTVDFDNPGHKFTIKLGDDGTVRCEPIHSWSVPHGDSVYAPGELAATNCWGAVEFSKFTNYSDFMKPR